MSFVESYNNSVNDNKVNAIKTRTSVQRCIKKLIKKVFNKHNKVDFIKNNEWDEEIEDNIANEILENEIFEEINNCDDDAAVAIYDEDSIEILPVLRGQKFIPVHFARTQAGTFFWTTVPKPDSDFNYHGDKNAICNYQTPELQAPCDRWAQA